MDAEPVILISFDIDGTLEGGDPPGPVPLEFVRRAVALGAIVGSSSDRTITDQRQFWYAGQVRTDFVVLKQQLPDLKARYPCRRYLHIGDSMVDEYYAGVAGFEFWNARSLARYAADQRLASVAMTEYLLHRLTTADQASDAVPPAAADRATTPEPGRRPHPDPIPRSQPLDSAAGKRNPSILSQLSTLLAPT